MELGSDFYNDNGTWNILFQKLHEGATLPKRMSPEAAGMDLYACCEDTALPPGERVLVPTGIAMALPPGYEGQVRPRSGLAKKHGVTVLNAPGTIDSDYRGEVGVILINHSTHEHTIKTGDRIAQLVIAQVAVPRGIRQVPKLPGSERGAGGFGSTGTRDPVDPTTLRIPPNNYINNCALANSDDEKNCQVCKGTCPDRERF